MEESKDKCYSKFIDLNSITVPGQEELYRLEYRYAKGQIVNYLAQNLIYQTSDAGPRLSRKSQQEINYRVSLKVIEKEAENCYIILYYDPIEHLIDGVKKDPGKRKIVYIKQNKLGEILETTEPVGRASLLLPQTPISADSQWKETEIFIPPHRLTPIEIVNHCYVTSAANREVIITYQAEEILYKPDIPSSEVTSHLLKNSGNFGFDPERGMLTFLETEFRLTSKEENCLLEVTTVNKMERVERE